MSSPGINPLAHDAQQSALTFVHPDPATADQSSPTFTVSSSSSSFTSLSSSHHKPAGANITSTPTTTATSTYMATVNNLKEDTPQSQCLFSYAELLSSQTTSLSADGAYHHSENGQLQREAFTQASASPPSFLSRASQESMNMLPPPPPMTSMAGLHPLNMPYSPSSPIARPLQQQQQQQQRADTSFYDGFGYPYVNNNVQGANRDNSSRPPRALSSPTAGMMQNFGHLCTSSSSSASSSSSRPVTPVSPLMSLSLDAHESKNMYNNFRRATMHDTCQAPAATTTLMNNGRDQMWGTDYAKPAQNDTLPPPPPPQPRSRGRRVSNVPTHGVRMFTCQAEGCGKVFKRSEHLKRHIRSIHTLEKPFECPYQSCHKRFSRSDNLNQHIRIHRHSNAGVKEKKRPGDNLRLESTTTTPTAPSSYHPFSNFCNL